MTKIKLVVFDMAGTTIHDESNVAKSFQYALHQFGYTQVTLEQANQKMGYSKPQAIRELVSLYELNPLKITSELVEAIHRAFVEGMLNFYREDPTVRPISDAEFVFKELHKMGIKVALDTGFNREITDIILARVGWANTTLIDATATSDEVPQGRPFPYMIQKIMLELGVSDPKMVVKVGDTEVDVNEGLRANCLMSIGITSGVFTKEELIPYKPTHLAASLTEVLELIQAYENAYRS